MNLNDSRGRTAALFALSIALLLALVASPASSQVKKFFPGKAYAEGTQVEVTGFVTDRNGQPIQDIVVVLEGARREVQWKKMRRINANPRRVTTRTGPNGEFSLPWSWHPYYNRFTLHAEVDVLRTGGASIPEILASADLTTPIKNGTPVVANLEIENREFLDSFRTFLASLDSNDEKNIYGSMGQPDKVETLKFPDREEVSWWYFEAGKTYRFKNGAVEQVVAFDPVTSFDENNGR